MVVEQVGEVGGGLVSEQKDFEVYSLWDREPVEFLEERGDVVTGRGWVS